MGNEVIAGVFVAVVLIGWVVLGVFFKDHFKKVGNKIKAFGTMVMGKIMGFVAKAKGLFSKKK